MLALSLGPDILAAVTIVPTHDVHVVVENSVGIDNITPPSPDFCGVIILISDSNNTASLSFGGGAGNIASSLGLMPSRTLSLTYNPTTSKWYLAN